MKQLCSSVSGSSSQPYGPLISLNRHFGVDYLSKGDYQQLKTTAFTNFCWGFFCINYYEVSLDILCLASSYFRTSTYVDEFKTVISTSNFDAHSTMRHCEEQYFIVKVRRGCAGRARCQTAGFSAWV